MKDLEKHIRFSLSGFWIESALTPASSETEVYWLFNELGDLVTKQKGIIDFMNTLIYGKDAVWMWEDPLPFLVLHYVQMPILLLKTIFNGTIWNKVNFCLGQVL